MLTHPQPNPPHPSDALKRRLSARMKPSLTGRGRGTGGQEDGSWKYRAHGLEVLTQNELPTRDGK